MIRIAIVGCTGKLGSIIMKNILAREDVILSSAIARRGNANVGRRVCDLIGGDCELTIVDDICDAADSDVFIDCTNAETFINSSIHKYRRMGKPVVIGTTAFSEKDMEQIRALAEEAAVFLTGNFSIALYHFIETLKFAARSISADTDVQIVEYHHNQKKDAPSGTALMIRDALVEANPRLRTEDIDICSVRGGSIFGEHEVVFANCKDEVMVYKHRVSSRETFADGAIEVAEWIVKQERGFYNMEDFGRCPLA